MNAFLGESYKKSVWNYVGAGLIYFGIGLIFALLLNNTLVSKLEKAFNLGKWTSITTQILLTIGLLYIVETYISPQFAADWQSTTPGFIFVSILFGVQIILFRNLTQVTEDVDRATQ